MFHALLLKFVVFVTGILAAIFPFLGSTQVAFESVSSSTPITNIEIASTTHTIAKKNTVLGQARATSTKITQPPASQTLVAIPVPPIASSSALTQAQISAVFDQINTLTRQTLVNIFCVTSSSAPFSSASGSGVIISSDGVIMTNAHIGQYLLLKDFNGQKNSVKCVIRADSPAYPVYYAELVYISPLWIKENSSVLIESDPTGTGEHDYALLKITSNVDGSAFTGNVPYMPISLNENVHKGDNILLDSYPAEFLGGINIEKDLYQATAISQISKVYTFGTNTIDVISVPGTVVSQKGSSGGAAVNQKGELTGIITTSSDADTTGGRDLRAITMTYINRDLTANADTNLKSILENPQAMSDTFNKTTAPGLTKILTDAILGN